MKQNADEMMLGKVTRQTIKINLQNDESKEKIASSNLNKLFNNDKIDQKNKFLGRNSTILAKEKPSEINQLFRNDFKVNRNFNKQSTIVNYKKSVQDAPQTNLEKIVEIMKKIKEKLNFYNEQDLAAEIEWVTKEILSNNIYKMKVDNKEGREENPFFDEYSNIKSEKLFNKDILKSGKILKIDFYFFRKSNSS